MGEDEKKMPSVAVLSAIARLKRANVATRTIFLKYATASHQGQTPSPEMEKEREAAALEIAGARRDLEKTLLEEGWI